MTHAELEPLLCGSADAGSLSRLAEEIPELRPMFGFRQYNPHHLHDVWMHTVLAVQNTPPEPVLRWAALLHDIGKPACFTQDADGTGHFYGHAAVSAAMAKEILARLRMPQEQSERIILLVRLHGSLPEPTERAVGRFLRRHGMEALRQLLTLSQADAVATGLYREETDSRPAILCCAERLEAEAQRFSLRELAVNGHDLAALGLQGAAIGQTLTQLCAQVESGQLPNNRDILLASIK